MVGSFNLVIAAERNVGTVTQRTPIDNSPAAAF